MLYHMFDVVSYVKVWTILLPWWRHLGLFDEKMVVISNSVFLFKIFWQICIIDFDKAEKKMI